MNNIFSFSSYFCLAICLISYEFGIFMVKKTKLAIFNPLLTAIVLNIFIITIFQINYEQYANGTQIINYLLTPVTICLGIPMYERFTLLKNNLAAIIVGILSGVLSGLMTILLCCKVLHLTKQQYATLLPKSVTTAIGIGISNELNGIVTITIAAIIVTGILGNIIAEPILKLFKIDNSIAKGIAIGTSSHGVGTAKALELGETEGAMSSLAIVVAGISTVILAPIFLQFY